MGKMLHNEARELLVESYEKTHNVEEIAKIFGVNKYTVYHCLKQSPVRFCASVNGIASAGLGLMDIACNLGNCYRKQLADGLYTPQRTIEIGGCIIESIVGDSKLY